MSDLGLQRGSVALRSSGPITFSPDGVLFVADNAAATIHAIDVGDAGAASGAEPFDLEHVDERVASYLGAAVSDVAIRDLAVHPVTHNVYLFQPERGPVPADAPPPPPGSRGPRGPVIAAWFITIRQ